MSNITNLPAQNQWQATGFAVGLPIASPSTTITVHLVSGAIKLADGVTLMNGTQTTFDGFFFSLNSDWMQLYVTPVATPFTTPSNAPTLITGTNPPQSIPNTATGASQTTPQPTTQSSAKPIGSKASSNGLSGGAVAGVAIGCLIAGALIAGLLAWFCFRRRSKQQLSRGSEASTLTLMHREKGPVAKAVSLEGGSPITASLENALPQPLEDAAISGEISKISNLIKNHVQSFYHTGRGSPGLLDFDDIQALGHDLPISTGTLSTLLTNSITREIGLRFCIAWVVISRMQPLKELNSNLLPPEVARCFQAMSFVDRGSKVHAVLLAHWRAITAELMQSAYVRNPFAPSDSRNANIQAAVDDLNSILQPYADSRMDNNQRKQNLEEILKRSALFAFTLFSQPSSWDFDWQDKSEVKSGSLCIFPALVQVTDENGELVRPPRAFNDPVVRRLDE